MTTDTIESVANAAIGLAISVVAVVALRAAGWWETAPAWSISALFFALSFGRARALRAAFRRAEKREGEA